MITTRLTGYGRPALEELRQTLEHLKRDDPLAPVTVLVPNQVASVVVRRFLAHGLDSARPGIAGLQLSTVIRLAERLAAPRLSPRRPATGPILAAAWRAALTADPGMFAEIHTHPSTVTALLRVHRELRGLDHAAIETVAGASGLAADVVRLHRQVTRALEPEFYDESDLLRAATLRVAEPDAAITDLGAVILYLPEDLTVLQADLVAALGAVTDVTVLAAVTGENRSDRVTAQLVERLTSQPPLPGRSARTATRVLHASDSDDEVRCVVRKVLADLGSVPAHRIGVLYSNPIPYARLVHEQLAAAGVRHNGPGSRPTIERSVPQGVIRLLDAVVRDLPRAELFEALSTTKIMQPDATPVPVSRWERVSRQAGIVSGDDWDHRLARFIERRQRAADEERRADEPSETRLDRITTDIELAESLRGFTTTLRRMAAQAATMPWPALSTAALEAFHHLFGDPDELLRLPAEERNAARDVELALRSVAAVGAFESEPPGVARLRDVVAAELESALPRVAKFGEGVFVGPVSAAVGLDLDVVYVLGLSEDLYPGTFQPEPLIPEPVRRSSDGALRTQRDDVDARHRHLLAAFDAAPTVFACFPRGNLRRSQPRLPSRWLLPTLRILSGRSGLVASEWEQAHAPMIEEARSFATGLQNTPLPATDQEWRTRAVRAGLIMDDPISDAAASMITGRASDSLSRYDGLVVAADLPDYADGSQIISPTRLETYAGCPHAYFLKHLLRVEPLENPEEIISISPLEIGNLMHEALDAMITEFGPDRLPGYGEPWSPIHHHRLQDLANDLAVRAVDEGKTGHPRLWQAERTRILRDLDQMLRDDDRWRDKLDARVLASELAFGLDGLAPVRVDLADDRAVLLRGRADKVDITSDDIVLVTDVKTGSPGSYTVITKDPVASGTKLQLPAYAMAAMAAYAAFEARAQYWFVRKDKKSIPITLDEATAERYRETLAILVDGIRAGLFPAKPPASDYGRGCAYCSPDGVSPEDLRRRWRRKRDDHSLVSLLSLIDPVKEGFR